MGTDGSVWSAKSASSATSRKMRRIYCSVIDATVDFTLIVWVLRLFRKAHGHANRAVHLKMNTKPESWIIKIKRKQRKMVRPVKTSLKKRKRKSVDQRKTSRLRKRRRLKNRQRKKPLRNLVGSRKHERM